MMVLGADMHKRSHTVAAVASVTGQLHGETTVKVGARGFNELLTWPVAWAKSACGRSRTAGMSPARLSASSSGAASESFASRRR